MVYVMVIFQHDILSMILCLHVHSSSLRAETTDEKVIKKAKQKCLILRSDSIFLICKGPYFMIWL